MEKMMKKLMFVLLAAVCCSSLMANVLIYDYVASFKRVNVTGPIKLKDTDGNAFYLDSPKVASDKFTGYMVIAECEQCGGSSTTMQNSARYGYKSPAGSPYADKVVVNPGNFAVVYIKRANSRFTYNKDKFDYRKRVYRAIGRFYVGMFGAKSGLRRADNMNNEVPDMAADVNIDKFTDAEGFLSYRLLANGSAGRGPNGTRVYYPGFLGIGHTGEASLDWWYARYDGNYTDPQVGNGELPPDYDTIDHAGFGKVWRVSKPGQAPDCFNVGGAAASACYRVKNLSGSMMGGFRYTSFCSHFLFDVCTLWAIPEAPINGTFSLKLNNGLSFPKGGSVANFEAAEYAVLRKMGATEKIDNETYVDFTLVYADPDETVEFNKKMGQDLADSADGVRTW